MLDEESIAVIEEILRKGNSAEIAIRNGKVVIWSVASKKKSEKPLTKR